VLGPAGIGKSRLRQEVTERLAARGGLGVHVATAHPGSALASHALLRALLLGILELPEAPGPEVVLAAPRRTLGTADEALVGALAALLGNAPLDARAPALAAARAALAAAAAQRPRVAVLDDAHWADDATLDLVESVARGDVDAPLGLLVLGRTALTERRPRLYAAMQRTLELAPLAAADAVRLAAAHLGASGPDAQALAEASEGNPFFIEELARERLERGAAGALPTTIEETLQARLDRLAEADRDVVRAASVLGRTFRRRDLALLLQQSFDEPALDLALARLGARQLVVALPPDAQADDRHALRHALLRDAAYGELPAAQRRVLHAAVAAAVRGRLSAAGEGTVEQWVELAHHLAGAGDALAAGAAFRTAGDLAASQEAPADAYRCFERARALLGAEVDLPLLVRLGELGARVGALGPAAAALDEVIARTERGAGTTERVLCARALLARAGVAREQARWTEAVSLLERGCAACGEDDRVLAARLSGALGWVLGYMLGQVADGLPAALRLPELAMAYSDLGANYMRASRYDDQLRCNLRTLEIGERIGSMELRARAHRNLGVTYMSLGQHADAAEHSRRAVDLYRRLGETSSQALVRSNLAQSLTEVGAFDEAAREFAESVRLCELCGGGYFRPDLECGMARLDARRGDLASARAHAELARELAQRSGSGVEEGVARRILGGILSRGGDHDGASRELDAASALLGTDPGELAAAGAERVRALVRCGQGAEAAELRERVRGSLRSVGALEYLSHLDDDGWI